jgi:hypothetical protein
MKVTLLLRGLLNGGIENMLADILNQQVEESEISLVVFNDKIEEM